MKTILLILTVVFITININSQTITIEWEKTYGGNTYDQLYALQTTSDSGYIAIGASWKSNDGFSGNHGKYDYSIIKLNKDGDIIWTKCYGGTDYDMGTDIKQTTDGGYIVSGYSESANGNINCTGSNNKAWIAKLNQNGDLVWSKCYGGINSDKINSIQQTKDGGYVAVGSSLQIGKMVTSDYYWILKLNSIGDTLWSKHYGGTEDDMAYSIIQTNDSNYMVAGFTYSFNEDVSDNHGSRDAWILKLDQNGNIIWSKCYGGSSIENSSYIQQLADGNFIIAGSSWSDNGDLSSNNGGADAWIYKINQNGEILWSKTYGGSDDDIAWKIKQTIDGGFIVAACWDMYQNSGESDVWIIKLNQFGEIIWDKYFGGSDIDYGDYVNQTFDGGYIVGATTESSDGDVSFNHGANDFWIIKLSLISNIGDDSSTNHFNLYPNPTKNNVQIKINNEQLIGIIEITDINGRIVKQLTVENDNNLTIDLSSQAKGIYFVKLIGEGFVSTQKLLLE